MQVAPVRVDARLDNFERASPGPPSQSLSILEGGLDDMAGAPLSIRAAILQGTGPQPRDLLS